MIPEPLPNPQQDPSEKIVARITPSASPRIETDAYVIHRDPRISATKLGEYLVTDPSKQKTILKNQKKAPKSIILRHIKTKLAFSKSLGQDGFDANYLRERAAKIRTETLGTEWQQQDNELSADALEKLAGVVNQIEIKNARKILRPAGGWGGLEVNGVYVSIEPTLVFAFTHRQATKIGATILYCTKDDSRSLSKELSGNCAGDYVSVLLLKLIEQKLMGIGVPLRERCQIIDVFRSNVHIAPKSFKTLWHHIEDACEMIKSRWDGI
jgi:hypothetical protein